MQESQRGPLTRVALLTLDIYRNTLSYSMLHTCRFFPSCSTYASQSLRRHGALKGGLLVARRLIRCHPFNRGGFDPVI